MGRSMKRTAPPLEKGMVASRPVLSIRDDNSEAHLQNTIAQYILSLKEKECFIANSIVILILALSNVK